MSKDWRTITIIFLLSIVFFSFKAGDITLQFTGDENFYFQSSKQMLEKGDWITPQYYEKKRFQKPFLFYWLVALAFKIFGITWWAARFPSILFGALAVVLVYLFGKELFNRQTGMLSAAILATSLKFFRYSRAAIPDMILLFFTTLTLYYFIRGYNNFEERRKCYLIFFVIAGIATLIKGPIGLITPLLVAIFFIIFSKEWNLLKGFNPSLGICLYILIVAPWFLIMVKLYGAEYIGHIWSREIFHRVGYFSETKQGLVLFLDYAKSLFFYIPLIFMRFFPWSLFLPVGIIKSFSLQYRGEIKKENLFILVWFFVIFVFFSLLGEKHSQYILAIAPSIALILGHFFWILASRKKRRVTIPITITLVLVFIFTLAFSRPIFKPNSATLSKFADIILESNLKENDRVAMGSHDLIPQKLEVYLNRPVEKLSRKLYDQIENEKINKLLLKELFEDRKRVFCVIKKEDFNKFVKPKLRKKLVVLSKELLWKRKINLRERIFREEYWLITNKE